MNVLENTTDLSSFSGYMQTTYVTLSTLKQKQKMEFKT